MTANLQEVLRTSADLLDATKGTLQIYDKQRDCLTIAGNHFLLESAAQP